MPRKWHEFLARQCKITTGITTMALLGRRRDANMQIFCFLAYTMITMAIILPRNNTVTVFYVYLVLSVPMNIYCGTLPKTWDVLWNVIRCHITMDFLQANPSVWGIRWWITQERVNQAKTVSARSAPKQGTLFSNLISGLPLANGQCFGPCRVTTQLTQVIILTPSSQAVRV